MAWMRAQDELLWRRSVQVTSRWLKG